MKTDWLSRLHTVDGITERQQAMARIWRKPGVLMTAYLVLFVLAVAWAAMTSRASAPHSPVPYVPYVGSTPIAAFLAWRVAGGGWFSRGLIIVYTVFLIQRLLWGADIRSGGLVSISLLVLCLIQVALVVSTPIYERTHKDRADRPPSTAPMWPTPPWWTAAVALAGGLLITLVFTASAYPQLGPCPPPRTSASPAQCLRWDHGLPVAFLADIPAGSQSYRLSDLTDKVAAAEDVAVWTVLSFAACYLIWLPSGRPAREVPDGVPTPA